MDFKPPKLLVVDDEPFNLEIIAAYLEQVGCELVTANDGLEAWDLLERAPDQEFDTLILDRMMPGMDGLTLLKKLKANPRYRYLPVIMQTAAASQEQVMEGIRNGAYYYLTKPFDGDMLATIVRAALSDGAGWRQLVLEAQRQEASIDLLVEGVFRFRTLGQARLLARALSSPCADGDSAALGLMELLVNAVEHGNLGISTRQKSALLRRGAWEEEVEARLALPENAGKVAEVRIRRDAGRVHFHLRDGGTGFDWRAFERFDPARAFEPNGRGIALAKQLSFPDIEYLGPGNEVRFSAAARVPQD